MLDKMSFTRVVTLFITLIVSAGVAADSTDNDLIFGILREDGYLTDFLYYSGGEWRGVDKNKTLSVKSWHLLDKDTNQAHDLGVVNIDETGDCGGMDWKIRTNTASMASKDGQTVWAVSRSEGYKLYPVKNIAYYSSSGNYRKISQKEIPSSLSSIDKHIKAEWSTQELALLSKVVPQKSSAKLKDELGASGYLYTSINKSIWEETGVELIHFSARKMFKSSLIPEDILYDGYNVFMDYNGIVAVYPDGRIDWLSKAVDLMPGDETNIDSYVKVRPLALLEVSGHSYVVAQSDENTGKGVFSNINVFEFEDRKVRLQYKYLASCEY